MNDKVEENVVDNDMTKAGSEVTKEQLQVQLNYAQKIITVLQNKVNDLNGKMVQIEAQLLCSNEDRETLIKQRLELEGNTEENIGESPLYRVSSFLDEFTETNNRFPGLVLKADNELKVLVKNGTIVSIPWSERMNWARPFINENSRGVKPKSYKD